MGISLAEYAAQHPQPEEPAQERQQMQTIAATIKDRAQELEQAAQLKESILHQLEKGNAPELILYQAIEAIGLLTNDPDFVAAGHGRLDAVYADLAQQSLITDNEAIAAHRLEQMQGEYIRKARASLTRQQSSCKRIADAIDKALQAVTELEQAQQMQSVANE